MPVQTFYSPIPDKESDSSCYESNNEYASHFNKLQRFTQCMHWAGHCFSVLAVAGLFLGIKWGLLIDQQKCWELFNDYSPVNEAVAPNPYIHQQFNGSLWYQSPFKGPPNDQVERAWYEIMRYGMISVSKKDIEAVHHPDWSAQFPAEAGGGYIAATIGSHQLHCLHYIWQDHYVDYFTTMQDKKRRIPEMYERHYEHCVDYIRQSLMCQFDTGIIPYNWVMDHQNPTPNANTHHKCVNWDVLQAWLEDRRVEVPEGFVWHQPDNAVAMSYNP